MSVRHDRDSHLANVATAPVPTLTEMRAIFVTYAVLIVAGILYCGILGLTHS
jgi:hypothetical protein